MSARTTSPLLYFSAYAALYIIWGSTYHAIRFAMETIPPFLNGSLRFFLAGHSARLVSVQEQERPTLRIPRRVESGRDHAARRIRRRGMGAADSSLVHGGPHHLHRTALVRHLRLALLLAQQNPSTAETIRSPSDSAAPSFSSSASPGVLALAEGGSTPSVYPVVSSI